MKILFLSHRFYPDIGGIEVNSEILASAFQQAGHEVRLLTWTKNPGDKNFSYDVIRHPNLQMLFRQHAWADLVYENNPCLRLAWPRLLYRKPGVVALRTWISRTDGRIAVQDKVKQRWLKSAAAVIAVSESVRQKCWPPATVIGNPYRTELFSIIPSIRRNRDFVFLGRLVTDKGAELAIRAIHQLKALQAAGNLPTTGLSLTVIGDGPQKEILDQLVKDLTLEDNVTFTGALSGKKLVETLNEHRYILVPSIWEEPFGNVALEGMACGCIPVVSNGGGLPDAVGNAGVLFERNNIEDMVSVVSSLLSNEALISELKDKAPAHLANHHPAKIAQKYLSVIETASR